MKVFVLKILKKNLTNWNYSALS